MALSRPLAAILILVAGAGCTAVSSSRPLSGRPPAPLPGEVVVLSGPPRAAYRTVGFVEVHARGATLAEVGGVSDTELDPVLRGALVRAAREARADGAILVDVRDVRPPLPATRPWSIERGGPPGRVRTRDRLLRAAAELFVFERVGGKS